jgi:hypothetical protein
VIKSDAPDCPHPFMSRCAAAVSIQPKQKAPIWGF